MSDIPIITSFVFYFSVLPKALLVFFRTIFNTMYSIHCIIQVINERHLSLKPLVVQDEIGILTLANATIQEDRVSYL